MIIQWHHADTGVGHSSLNAYYNVTFYVPYERLVSPTLSKRPILLAKLADELRRAGATSVAAAADIPCIWRTAVLDQPRKQRNRSYYPSFTVEQQQIYGGHAARYYAATAGPSEYIYEIQTNLHIDD
jgi:hypothetical protein